MKCLHVLLGLVLALFSAVTFAQAININTASVEELDKGVQGLGPTKAAAIVKYREAHGPFTSVNDLTKVTGIKEKALEGLLADKRNQLTVGEVAAPTTPAMPATPAEPCPGTVRTAISEMKVTEVPVESTSVAIDLIAPVGSGRTAGGVA